MRRHTPHTARQWAKEIPGVTLRAKLPYMLMFSDWPQKCGLFAYERQRMDEKTIKAIEAILAKDERVELIPTKDGVKVIHIKRENVKIK